MQQGRGMRYVAILEMLLHDISSYEQILRTLRGAWMPHRRRTK